MHVWILPLFCNGVTTTGPNISVGSVTGAIISRLTVVSRKAKKEQSELPKTKRATNYCVSFTRANVFVI